MKRFLVFGVLAAALLLAACTNAPAVSPTEKVALPAVESNPGEVTPASDGYPAVDAPASEGYPALAPEVAYPVAYDANTRTGVEMVDRVLAAVFTNNPADLQGLLSFEMAPCTTAEGLGGPPKCRDGGAENTQLEVLPSLGAEGSFVRRSELPADYLAGPFNLIAVYEVKADVVQEDYYPAGKWGIVLTKLDPSGATLYYTLRVGESGIVRVDTDAPGNEFRDAGTFLLGAQ